MIRSMTGFGRGRYTDDVKTITVEIKAVNHRYCDIYVKMPRRFTFAEEAIKAEVKKQLSRGKIEISVSVDNFGSTDEDVRLDKALAQKYYEALTELEKSYEFSQGTGGISLALLAKMPDVIRNAPAEADEEEMLRCL